MLYTLFVLAVCLGVSWSSGPCAPKEDLLQMLNLVHASASFAHLTPASKAMVPELLAAAQSCQLTEYVYKNGLYKLFDLLNELTPHDGHLLNSYLKAHLEFEQQLAKMFPGTTRKA